MNRSPKRVNIKDVAAAAEVSIATVSRVLNGKTEHIKPDTEKRVLKVVDELGYVPNEIARSLKISQSSRTIGLIVPCLDDILSRVAEGVFAEAAERGYGVYVAMVKGEQTAESCVRSLISRRAESIVSRRPVLPALNGFCPTSPFRPLLSDINMPRAKAVPSDR